MRERICPVYECNRLATVKLQSFSYDINMKNNVMSEGCRDVLRSIITFYTFWVKFGILQEFNLKFLMYKTQYALLALPVPDQA